MHLWCRRSDSNHICNILKNIINKHFLINRYPVNVPQLSGHWEPISRVYENDD